MAIFSVALEACLRDRGRAVISHHAFSLVVDDLYRNKGYGGEVVKVQKEAADDRDISRYRKTMFQKNILANDSDVSTAYRVVVCPDEPAESVICEVDPLVYVSHFSALQRHGLTDRNPVELQMTRPTARLWNEQIARTVKGRVIAVSSEQSGSVELTTQLRRPFFPGKVRKRAIQIHDTRHPGDCQTVRGTPVRVATVGQSFADSVARPQWCGGISHVMNIWEKNAYVFLDEIIDSIDRSTTNLTKIRAGYILAERLHIQDSRIDAWTKFVQRGSSQVLDPTQPFAPTFSEKWMLSLNAYHGTEDN
jgi:predicted transcriptional regulator of viral defense system